MGKCGSSFVIKCFLLGVGWFVALTIFSNLSALFISTSRTSLSIVFTIFCSSFICIQTDSSHCRGDCVQQLVSRRVAKHDHELYEGTPRRQ